MDSALLQNVILTVVCVVLAAFTAWILPVGGRRNQFAFLLIWLFTLPVYLVLVFLFVAPAVVDWEVRYQARRIIRDDPLFSILSDRHPEIRNEMRDVAIDLVKENHRGPSARRMAFQRLYSLNGPYFEAYLPAAQDDPVKDYASALIRVLAKLINQPGAPAYWVATTSVPPDGSSLNAVPEAEIEDLHRSMAAVIRSAAANPRPRLSGEEVELYTDLVVENLRTRLGPQFDTEVRLLDQPATTDAERNRIGVLLLNFYVEAYRLPNPHRAKALRALFMS